MLFLSIAAGLLVSIPLRALDLCRPGYCTRYQRASGKVSIPLRALDLCRRPITFTKVEPIADRFPYPSGRWTSVDAPRTTSTPAPAPGFHTPQGVGPLSTYKGLYREAVKECFHTPQGVGPLSTYKGLYREAVKECFHTPQGVGPLSTRLACAVWSSLSSKVSIPLRALDLCRLNVISRYRSIPCCFHTPQGVGPLSTTSIRWTINCKSLVSIPLRALDLCRHSSIMG